MIYWHRLHFTVVPIILQKAHKLSISMHSWEHPQKSCLNGIRNTLDSLGQSCYAHSTLKTYRTDPKLPLSTVGPINWKVAQWIRECGWSNNARSKQTEKIQTVQDHIQVWEILICYRKQVNFVWPNKISNQLSLPQNWNWPIPPSSTPACGRETLPKVVENEIHCLMVCPKWNCL